MEYAVLRSPAVHFNYQESSETHNRVSGFQVTAFECINHRAHNHWFNIHQGGSCSVGISRYNRFTSYTVIRKISRKIWEQGKVKQINWRRSFTWAFGLEQQICRLREGSSTGCEGSFSRIWKDIDTGSVGKESVDWLQPPHLITSNQGVCEWNILCT